MAGRHEYDDVSLSTYSDNMDVGYGVPVIQQKPPRSPRGSRNSHFNPKKRRIYTFRFYEDLTVYINLKIPCQIQIINIYNLRSPTKYI